MVLVLLLVVVLVSSSKDQSMCVRRRTWVRALELDHDLHAITPRASSSTPRTASASASASAMAATTPMGARSSQSKSKMPKPQLQPQPQSQPQIALQGSKGKANAATRIVKEPGRGNWKFMEGVVESAKLLKVLDFDLPHCTPRRFFDAFFADSAAWDHKERKRLSHSKYSCSRWEGWEQEEEGSTGRRAVRGPCSRVKSYEAPWDWMGFSGECVCFVQSTEPLLTHTRTHFLTSRAWNIRSLLACVMSVNVNDHTNLNCVAMFHHVSPCQDRQA